MERGLANTVGEGCGTSVGRAEEVPGDRIGASRRSTSGIMFMMALESIILPSGKTFQIHGCRPKKSKVDSRCVHLAGTGQQASPRLAVWQR